MLTKTMIQKISKKPYSRRFSNKITWTFTDEAPSLATYSLLPIIEKFTKKSNIDVELVDISLAGRILSEFNLSNNGLQNLGNKVKTDNANIIKLPNVSASIPQLESSILELQSKGYKIPDYKYNPKTKDEINDNKKFQNILGSAVNPVLREGNSDRRVPQSVKNYITKNPHKLKSWSHNSRTKVAHMNSGDFYESEKSNLIEKESSVSITLFGAGNMKILKSKVDLKEGDVVDTSFLSISKLQKFYQQTFDNAKKDNLMTSLHLKATMMKISDPILFGKAIETYFSEIFCKYNNYFIENKINSNNGLASIFQILDSINDNKSNEIKKEFIKKLDEYAKVSYVDSNKGITNFHSPSNVIIDASMPVVIRDGGKMWNKNDEQEDTVCIIPDRSYAKIYQTIIDDCKQNGQLNVSSIGSVSNVGLMAKKAEEYGSHDKTFVIPFDGVVKVYDDNKIISMHKVSKGDIWRMCITEKEAIDDWIKLAIKRNEVTNSKTIFWLDKNREHDNLLSSLVKSKISNKENITIENPSEAMKSTLSEIRLGNDVITVTGNVLRDYLTDLFPILELGTSAKMLSIVNLLAGGSLFETGAGGTAPKHVNQLIDENHLRWDSIGEYLALAESLSEYGNKNNNKKALLLSETLNLAIEKLLTEEKFPSRKVHQIDNRGSNFYLALYWSEFMAEKDDKYKEIYQELLSNKSIIIDQLNSCQGNKIDVGGYWKFDDVKVKEIMNPSTKLSEILKK